MSEPLSLPTELHAAADALVQNLLASEPFLAYHQSQAQLDSDAQARALLARFSAHQASLQRKQARGRVTQAEIEELGAIQAEVQANATIVACVQARQGAIDQLREVNQEISQLLGVDFASLARQTKCC